MRKGRFFRTGGGKETKGPLLLYLQGIREADQRDEAGEGSHEILYTKKTRKGKRLANFLKGRRLNLWKRGE